MKKMECIKENKHIFKEAFKKYGDDPRACLWDKPMTMRYQELVNIGNLENSTILEIGCGLGGLYEYIRANCENHKVSYTGVDIVEEMIELDQKKYPEAKFTVKNILQEPLQKKYDYVFLCGVFNMKTDSEFMKQMLKEAFSYCKKGMAFNFISTYVNFKSEEMSYHSPQEIFTFCVEELSRKVDMHHHYAKCDVSMFVYREE